MSERISKFRNYHSMAILGVPDVRVLKPVHVDLELTVGVEVHVGNEEMCDRPSMAPPLESR